MFLSNLLNGQYFILIKGNSVFFKVITNFKYIFSKIRHTCRLTLMTSINRIDVTTLRILNTHSRKI